MKASRKKLLRNSLAEHREAAGTAVGKRDELAKPNPLFGLFKASEAGKLCLIKYELDPKLNDSEKVQQLEAGGIEGFLRGELVPYAPDSCYDLDGARVGWKMSIIRRSYKSKRLRSLTETGTEI